MSIQMHLLVPGSSLSFRGGFFGFSAIALLNHPQLGWVLFDTGHHSTRHRLLAGLARHGLSPVDIGHVFISHMHFDHINNIDLFPDAHFYLSESEWDYSAAPDPRDIFGSVPMREWLATRNLTFIGQEGELALGLHYRHAPGHTGGITLLHFVDADGRRVVLAGDACKTYRELVTGQAGEAYDPLDRSLVTLSWIRDNADVIICGHHPVLNRGAEGWFWEEPATLELIVR